MNNKSWIIVESDSRFTKSEVILLMEWARDKGERDGEILWMMDEKHKSNGNSSRLCSAEME